MVRKGVGVTKLKCFAEVVRACFRLTLFYFFEAFSALKSFPVRAMYPFRNFPAIRFGEVAVRRSFLRHNVMRTPLFFETR